MTKRRIFFSFSRISKIQKRVHECIYYPTPLYTFYSIARRRVCTYARAYVFQFSLRNNGESQMNGRKLACSFFFFKLFQLRNADFTMRIERDCAAQFSPTELGRRCLISNQRSLTLHRSSPCAPI